MSKQALGVGGKKAEAQEGLHWEENAKERQVSAEVSTKEERGIPRLTVRDVLSTRNGIVCAVKFPKDQPRPREPLSNVKDRVQDPLLPPRKLLWTQRSRQ